MVNTRRAAWACFIFSLAACAGTSGSEQGGLSGLEIGSTNVAEGLVTWVGKTAQNVKDHWVVPGDATTQYVGGNSAARERARQECVQNAIAAAQNAQAGNRAAASFAGSASGRLGTPMLARATSSSYVGAVQNSTWIGPLVRLGAVAATAAAGDNLQSLVDQGTSDCMMQRGYRPAVAAPAPSY